MRETQIVLRAIDVTISQPYTAESLYKIFATAFLLVPDLWESRDEFQNAVRWQTRLIRGSIKIVDSDGNPLGAQDRMRELLSRKAP